MADFRLSNTNQRRVILEELRSVTSHPTAEEVYIMVRRRLPQISLATVYRNLDLLTDIGEVLRLEKSGRKKRYDGNPNPHHHLRCVRCGAVEDLDLHDNGALALEACQYFNEKITGVSIEFTGFCERCLTLPPEQRKRKGIEDGN